MECVREGRRAVYHTFKAVFARRDKAAVITFDDPACRESVVIRLHSNDRFDFKNQVVVAVVNAVAVFAFACKIKRLSQPHVEENNAVLVAVYRIGIRALRPYIIRVICADSKNISDSCVREVFDNSRSFIGYFTQIGRASCRERV